MEKIKKQIEEVVTFKSTTLEELSTEKTAMLDRIYKGVQNMKDSKLFYNEEIQEIENFAYHLFDEKLCTKKESIIKQLRDNFVF